MTARFLRSVFGGQDKGFLALFNKPSKHSTFIPLNHEGWHGEAAKSAMVARERDNVYLSVGVQGQRPHRGRGKQAGVIALPGLWADLDVLGPNHAATNLPPTLEDAWSIIRAIPFKPTVAVYSGGGIQLHWLFREPMETVTEKDRSMARRLSRGFQALLAAIAAKHGWGIDNTSDLCRLLRVPGTYNRKQETPVLVRFEVIDSGQRYNPSEFEEFIELEADPELKAHVQGAAPENPRAESLRVLAGVRGCNTAKTMPRSCRSLSGIACFPSSGDAEMETRSPMSLAGRTQNTPRRRPRKTATGDGRSRTIDLCVYRKRFGPGPILQSM
jgi:hypothetical protein